MSRSGRVLVAMSGGVDSSVAAALLRQQGYDCVGVFMRVGAEPPAEQTCSLPTSSPPRRLRHGCCSATDAEDARAIAGRLGIPFYAMNFRDEFEQIIDYFVDEYANARTPNPCVMCNIHLKFGRLLRLADAMDAQFVATGHYARILRDDGASPRLARGTNYAKDQSYVLFGIQRADLGRCLLPIGDISDKSIVRQFAQELGLRVHDKPDSQEICFVPDQDFTRLLDQRRPGLRQPGPIIDQAGRRVGTHAGVASYTIGQRRGLGLALGRPAYVTALRVLENVVEVGDQNDVLAPGLVAKSVNWLVDVPPAGTVLRARVKIRHMHEPAPCEVVTDGDGGFAVRFDAAQPAVTPGQAAVIYQDNGDVVLGGGWIDQALR